MKKIILGMLLLSSVTVVASDLGVRIHTFTTGKAHPSACILGEEGLDSEIAGVAYSLSVEPARFGPSNTYDIHITNNEDSSKNIKLNYSSLPIHMDIGDFSGLGTPSKALKVSIEKISGGVYDSYYKEVCKVGYFRD